MGWADNYIAKLAAGETFSFRPRGDSMTGKINSGQKVTVTPCTPADVEVGDIVLCRVKGNTYLHLVAAKQEDRFLIKNNRGHENGWTKQIYGKVLSVED